MTASPSTERPGRYERSFRGLAGALLVILLVLAVFVGFRGLTRGDQSSPVPAVNYHPELRYAQRQATFRLLAPARLPAGWKATSVNFRPGRDQHWHLGMLTAAQHYVGVEQGDVSVAQMTDAYLRGHPRAGRPVNVAGSTWSTYSTASGDLGVVRRAGRTTDLVVGHDVPRRTLLAFLASLR